MIITRALSVANKKRLDIVAELKSLKFKPFPKKKGAREEGETAPALEEEDEGLASDYDYLLGMALWNLTAEKVRTDFVCDRSAADLCPGGQAFGGQEWQRTRADRVAEIVSTRHLES